MTFQEQVAYINGYVATYGPVKIDHNPDAMVDHDETRYVYITVEHQMQATGPDKEREAWVAGPMARTGELVGFTFYRADVDKICRAMQHDEEMHKKDVRYTPGNFFKMATWQEHRAFNGTPLEW